LTTQELSIQPAQQKNDKPPLSSQSPDQLVNPAIPAAILVASGWVLKIFIRPHFHQIYLPFHSFVKIPGAIG
jgi:hypothetical protein